jgi:uncharacterized protein (DUF1697 family)
MIWSREMAHLVALLRGINLGSRNRIGMADLRALLGDLGYDGVRTHLQSGNVVLTTRQGPKRVGPAIERGIRERFGLDVDVIVRTSEEIAEIIGADPLGDMATDGSRYFVVFLSDAPDPAAIRALTGEDFAPERLAVRGRELYAWCPEGVRDSRLFKALGRQRLAPTSTFRNWNTVTKLAEMAG